MKNILPLSMLLLIIFSMNTLGQMTTPSVISTSGGFFSNGNGELSTTIGEMTMVQTFTDGNRFLTQGFQQQAPDSIHTAVNELNGTDLIVKVYPNPSNGIFNVAVISGKSFDVELKVFDILGIMTYEGKFLHSSGTESLTLNLEHLPDGIYLLEFSSITLANINQPSIINKINIIH
jgi:hypothetical protein